MQDFEILFRKQINILEFSQHFQSDWVASESILRA